jgi:hypothetical protein
MIVLTQKQIYAIVVVGLIIFATAIVFIVLAAAGITVGGAGGFDNSESVLMSNTQYYLFPNSVYPGTDGNENRTHTHCITGTATTNFVTMNSVGLDNQAGCALKDLSRFIFYKIDNEGNPDTSANPQPIYYNSDQVAIAVAQESEVPRYINITGELKDVALDQERLQVAGITSGFFSVFRIADIMGTGQHSQEEVVRKGNGGFTIMLSNVTRPSGLSLHSCLEDVDMDPVDRKGCGIFPPGTTDPSAIKNSKVISYQGRNYSTISVLGVGPSSSIETDGTARFHAYLASEIFI